MSKWFSSIPVLVVLIVGFLAGLIAYPLLCKTTIITMTETKITTALTPITVITTKIQNVVELISITREITVVERVTESVTRTVTESFTTTVTKTLTETLAREITVLPIICPYRELFNRTVSNMEGDTILVWRGKIDCYGVLTVITGGCKCEGAWAIKIINNGYDSGWIEVPCTCKCNNFRVVPGTLEVWVGWCKGKVCPLCIDNIHVGGILGGVTMECLC